MPEILPQGRTQFWRPSSIETIKFSTEEEEEEIIDENHIQMPAPLLQPIGDDEILYTNQSPWSIGLTMSIMREFSLCYVRSNVWPGSFTLSHTGYAYSKISTSEQSQERLLLEIPFSNMNTSLLRFGVITSLMGTQRAMFFLPLSFLYHFFYALLISRGVLRRG